jgi:hypothetical protein
MRNGGIDLRATDLKNVPMKYEEILHDHLPEVRQESIGVPQGGLRSMRRMHATAAMPGLFGRFNHHTS